ncbi:hypothetical protein NDU88_001198 [Pleurodeles waltl]|uniref:Uncharacterized protein n=1 Tax=Pleurodeles waltl TaxID=8319 RepID=A0AAV7KNX4_PLEWA|nr:hypothetical protein NDU88_001198 [Pleurodeles waltl]
MAGAGHHCPARWTLSDAPEDRGCGAAVPPWQEQGTAERACCYERVVAGGARTHAFSLLFSTLSGVLGHARWLAKYIRV